MDARRPLIQRNQDWPLALRRRHFFLTLDEEVPEVREELFETVFPAFKISTQALIARAPSDSRTNPPLPADPEEADFDSDPTCTDWYFAAIEAGLTEVAALRRSLDAWTARHRLEVRWFLDGVLRTMLTWETEPAEAGTEWHPYLPEWVSANREGDTPMRFEAEWEPTFVSRSKARKRILKRFESELDTFLDERGRRASSLGFEPSDQLAVKPEHMRLLIQYQVLGETFTDLARKITPDDPEASRQTVTAGVKRASELVDLPLRPPDEGALKR